MVLETIKLLFLGFHVEEVRAWIFNPWKRLEPKSTKEALMNILPLSHVVPSFPSPAADMQSQSLGF